MRAKEFLLEGIDDQQALWTEIKTNCAPFLVAIGGPGKFFDLPICRGSTDSGQNLTVREMQCPVDRLPRDTPTALHYAADEWFASNTGIAFRSNAFFGTGDQATAVGYGKGKYEILVPVGDFHYCWSDMVHDMTEVLDRTPVEDGESETDFVNAVLDDAGYFLNAHLEKAIKSGNEIMINCKSAYLINPGLFFMIQHRIHDGSIR